MAVFFQILLNNFYYIGVLALSTLGLALTYKTANLTNFAQSIAATTSAFAAAFTIMKVVPNLWIGTIAGVIVGFMIGFIIDAVIIRRAKVDDSGRVMITLGLIILFNAFIPLIFGMIPYEFGRYFSGNISFNLLGTEFIVTKNGLFIFAVSFGVVGLIFAMLNLTKWGLGVRGTASNRQVASMMGINTNTITAISWAVSAACGALSAIFYASQTTNVSIDMLASLQSQALLAFVLGGYSSFYGPVLGAILIPMASIIFSLMSGLWSNALMYVAILLVILVKPKGLFAKATIQKV